MAPRRQDGQRQRAALPNGLSALHPASYLMALNMEPSWMGLHACSGGWGQSVLQGSGSQLTCLEPVAGEWLRPRFPPALGYQGVVITQTGDGGFLLSEQVWWQP
jgi:hypothetical protein